MSEKKILFIDVDGTLLDYETRLPESARSSIRKARANGHKVYICTGRSEAEIYDYIWEIGLDGMIGGNGAYIKDGDTVVFHQHISAEDERHIVDWLQGRGLEFYLESNSGLYGSRNFETRGEPVIAEYMNRKGKSNAGSVKVRDVLPEMIFGADLYRDDVNKVSFILESYEDHLASIREFSNLKCGTWGGEGQTALFGDIGVNAISKSTAVQKLLDYTGADLADTIAFGDANVDIPMMEYCHIGVAMGNGSDECKEAADYVTDRVEEDGLCNAFKYLKLI